MNIRKPHARIGILFGVLVLCLAIVGGKLYMIQIVRGERYRERAEQQYVHPDQNLYNRGDIYFKERSGQLVPAATLRTGYVAAINPERITDPKRTFRKLRSAIDVTKDEFLQRASKKNDPYEEISTKLSATTAEQIQHSQIKGVTVNKQKWRYYPGEEMAAKTIGFVGYKGDTRAGRYGLERSYEKILRRDNDQLYVNFFADVFSNVKKTFFSDNKNRGDLVTGLEPNVQAYFSQVLRRVHKKWDASLTGGIIMDPETGQIYAMSSHPSFDPNQFRNVTDQSRFSNPLVENVYELGSIMKPITMAIGLDTGAITPDTTYTDEGYVMLNGERIENYDGEARGRVDMQAVLNESLNTGAAFIADRVGKNRFTSAMLDFGFGKRTGVDLPNEATGLVDNLHSPRRIEHATAAFGQGVAVSPIAMTRALSALANGGHLVKPHVGHTIDLKNGGSNRIDPPPGKQVIGATTSDTITRMLVDVVDEALKNGTVALENHSIAAKTGTAQIAKEDERGYYEDRFLHSFFGYAPAYEPRFIVFLYTVRPKGAQYASQTLTSPFMDTIEYLINYYQIPPDR